MAFRPCIASDQFFEFIPIDCYRQRQKQSQNNLLVKRQYHTEWGGGGWGYMASMKQNFSITTKPFSEVRFGTPDDFRESTL